MPKSPFSNTPDPNTPDPRQLKRQATPFSAFCGSALAVLLALLLYRLTVSIAQTFATHPLQSSSQIAISFSTAVRTLVVGMGAMATGIFSVAALGLVGLAVQILWQRVSQPDPNIKSS